MSKYTGLLKKEDVIQFFLDNGLVINAEMVADLNQAVDVIENVNGGLNVTVYKCNKNGIIAKNGFGDCYLLTDKKIYPEQDNLDFRAYERLNRNYRNFMIRTLGEAYKQDRDARALADDGGETMCGCEH